jgi:hypothetical protein
VIASTNVLSTLVGDINSVGWKRGMKDAHDRQQLIQAAKSRSKTSREQVHVSGLASITQLTMLKVCLNVLVTTCRVTSH